MKILKNAYTLTVSQRKSLAVFMLVLALTNCQVSAVHAADPTAQADQPVVAQNVTTETSTAMAAPQPELAAVPAIQIQPTVQDVLLNVCEANGYGQDCAQTLLGILWNESANVSTAIGDHGQARGYFQIHYKLHKITIACAEELVCSANWTLTYMEAHSYPKYVSYAVQCHNSCNVSNGYAARALRNGKLYWDQPLEITQAAPIELAMN